MITVVGNMKGGTGKSTITFNLAVWLTHQNKRIRLFDLDPQQTLTDVLDVRQEEAHKPLLPTIENQAQLSHIKEDQNTDEILIDVSMSNESALKEALQLCDRILIPVAPSQADIWSIQRFIKMIHKTCTHQPEIFALINRAETHPETVETKESEEALDFLPGMKRLRVRLHNRTAYRLSLSEGLGVFELNPRSKACKEIKKLTKKLYKK